MSTEPRSTTATATLTITKGYADSRFGQLHYAESGTGAPVLLLHQTPRSWDEYRDVLPLLGAHRRAIALDTLGFGASARTPEPFRIELFADAVEDLIDTLGLTGVSLVGHHTGGVVAIEVAARRGQAIENLVLSGVPYVDAARRARVAGAPPIDHVTPAPDGSHLAELWNKRRAFYPDDRPDLLARLVADGLRVVDRVEEGHRAVNAYRMEERIRLVRSRTLVLCGEDDSYSLPDVPQLCAAIPGATAAVLPGTGVASVDHRPDLFSAAVATFLDDGAAG
ncbi:alpha/beta fold hydrolase [Pimelobacter simplex]|uniref:alpha/beta fold hydrolase n=1 Tax=Nocardioides simplex TaxID=2045 RepID=UPI003670A087